MNRAAIDKATAGLMCLTVNLHGDSVELRVTDEARLVGRYSGGGYMPNGVDRLLQLFERRGLCATFFVPALEAERNPELVREIHAAGHEIAAHGYALEDHSKLGKAEPDILRKAHEILASCVGEAPVGWRAPDGMLSTETLSHLTSLGYLYDSSFQDDDHPYLLDADGGVGLVELPQEQILIDQTLFAHKVPDVRVLKNWVEIFDGLNMVEAFVCMTLHPRQDYGVGRAPRIVMLERFLEHMTNAAKPMRFSTCAEVAKIVKAL